MGYVEDLWLRKGQPTARYGSGKRYRSVPQLAGGGGLRARRGPTKTFHDYREAEIYWAQIEGGAATALAAAGLNSRGQRRPKFADYVAEVAATLGAAKDTRNSYATTQRALAAEWPTQYVDEITHLMVKSYFSKLIDRGYSSSARAKRRTVLRETMRCALRDGYIVKDPTEGTIGINQRKGARKKRPVSEVEFGWLIEETPAWLRPALFLGYDSGLRSGEITGLHWRDVDLDEGFAHIETVMKDDHSIKPEPKNGVPADVPLTPRTVAAFRKLQERFGGGPDDLVFREPHTARNGGGPITPRRYRTLFYRSCRLAVLDAPWPHPHDLRHGTAGRLLDAGVPIHVVKSIMRHLSLASTEVYLPDVSRDAMRAALALLAEGDTTSPAGGGDDEPDEAA